MEIGPSCYSQANKGIHLGSRCLFAPVVRLINSIYHAGTAKKSTVANEIFIASDVFIRANRTILSGVSVADGVVI